MYAQHLIHEMDKTVNPAGVEGSMRSQYGTLDHLDRATFAEEIEIAKATEAEYPGHLRRCAENNALAKYYDKWEKGKGLTTDADKMFVMGYAAIS